MTDRTETLASALQTLAVSYRCASVSVPRRFWLASEILGASIHSAKLTSPKSTSGSTLLHVAVWRLQRETQGQPTPAIELGLALVRQFAA